MAAETQKLVDTERKVVYKFYSNVAETDVKKVDVSTLNWAKHTLTLSAASTENFKVGEVITTAATEHFLVTGFTAGASTVEVVGWDNTNKTATTILTTMSNGDAIVGGVSGTHTETVANSGNLTELDYNVLVTKIQWMTNGENVKIEWDGSSTEAVVASIGGNGVLNLPYQEFPGIGSNATGDTGGVLGDIQFSTVGFASGDDYTIIMECKKQAPGYDIPQYELNASLGFTVDFVLGNR
jgi:hypothetical protein